MNGFWIVLSGTGGELDRKFVESEEKITEAVIEMIKNLPLGAGDTIRVEEGWSEKV